MNLGGEFILLPMRLFLPGGETVGTHRQRDRPGAAHGGHGVPRRPGPRRPPRPARGFRGPNKYFNKCARWTPPIPRLNVPFYSRPHRHPDHLHKKVVHPLHPLFRDSEALSAILRGRGHVPRSCAGPSGRRGASESAAGERSGSHRTAIEGVCLSPNIRCPFMMLVRISHRAEH